MDQQKTGLLIARQRKQLNMTQKMLAEKVGVSDRTISKWERGMGFPDVSLIEPLADALELSLPELFQGEAAVPSPAEDTSAREMLRFIQHKTRKQIRKYRLLVLLLCASLALLLAVHLLQTAGNRWIADYSTSAEAAVAIAPEILITADDYAVLDAVLSDAVLEPYYVPYPLWQEITEYTLENEDAFAFTDYFDDLGLDLQYAGIHIHGSNITISYSTINESVYLQYSPDKVTKTVILAEQPFWDEAGQLIPMGKRHGKRIDLLNINNKAFYQGGYTTGWLEHFRKTYY